MLRSTKKQKGFTLVELVVVVVILGILSAVAAPKFLDLRDRARLSALYGLAGAIRSSVDMVYAQAVVEGKHTIPEGSSIVVDGETVNLVYGVPATREDLEKVVTGLDEWPVSTLLATDRSRYPVVTYGYDYGPYTSAIGCGVAYFKSQFVQQSDNTFDFAPSTVTIMGRGDCYLNE